MDIKNNYLYLLNIKTKDKMKIRMQLITKEGVVETKICTKEIECYVFERDMPVKHGLLFGSIEYIISKVNLNLI